LDEKEIILWSKMHQRSWILDPDDPLISSLDFEWSNIKTRWQPKIWTGN
jgi:hypothetical protein